MLHSLPGAPVVVTSQTKQSFDKCQDGTCLGYFPQSDWDVFKELTVEFDDPMKLACMVQRLKKGNMFKVTDATAASLVALLAAVNWDSRINMERLYRGVRALQHAFAQWQCQPVSPDTFLQVWLELPNQLPAILYKNMYGEMEPVPKESGSQH